MKTTSTCEGPCGHRRVRRFPSVILAVSAMLAAGGGPAAAIAPAPGAPQPEWAVPYGMEFWHESRTPPAAPDRAVTGAPALRLGEVVDRVAHAFLRDRAEPTVDTRDYRATADASGWRFEPRTPTGPGDGAALVFRTSEILRGGGAIPQASAPERSARGNTVQTRLAPDAGIVEHVEARAAGLEVSWIFAAPPPGSGDLEIRLTADGLAPSGSTASGSHYADAAGVPRVRVGPARAVDARGRTWKLATVGRPDGLAVRVPESVLHEAAWPLAIDPVISAEFGLDGSVHHVPDANTQGNSAVATDGTNWFVAWDDWGAVWPSESDIHAARVSAAGIVLDPDGIAVSAAADSQGAPAVAWNGTNYFVAWEDGRSGTDTDIYGARVTPAGAVLDPSGIVVSSSTNDQRAPAVAWNNGVHYVAWEEGTYSSANIRGGRVTADGSTLDGSGSNLCAALRRQALPSISPLGDGFLVVWDDERNADPDIYGTRVSGAGVPLDPAGIAITRAADAQQNPSVAWNGREAFVVWGDTRDGVSFDIYGARVATNGTVVDTSGLALCTQSGDQDEAAVSWNGSRFLVAWADWRNGTNTDYDIYATRVNTNGTVADAGGFLVAEASGYQGAPALARLGTNTLVTWTDMRRDSDVYAARVSDEGTVLDHPAFAVSLGPNRQRIPAAATDGQGWLVVWEDDRNGTDYNLYAARANATGMVLDAEGFVVTAATNSQRQPAVLWNGTNYFVTWLDYRYGDAYDIGADIFAARVTPGGAVLDPGGIAVCTNASEQAAPVVSWDGANHLVVWADSRGADSDIYAARVTAAGSVLDPAGIPVSTTGEIQNSPAVVWNGTHHVVVWEDYRDSQADLYAARIASDGTVLDVGGFPVCTESHDQMAPAIAWNGSSHLVVWEDYRSETNAALFAGRLNSAGAALDGSGFGVVTNGTECLAPTVAWDGYTHVAAWVNMSGTQAVHAARITASGSVVDTESLHVLDDAAGPALAATGGRTIVAGFGMRSGVDRVVARILDNDLVRLVVVSAHGTPSPFAGTNTYFAGTQVAPLVAGTPAEVAATQYVCTGWSGTGGVPGSGLVTSIDAFALSTDSVLTWLWQTNYYLDTAAGHGGTVTVADGWKPAHHNASVGATASNHFHFAAWTGDVPPGLESANPLDLPMDRPRIIAATFAENIATNGVPEWWLAAHGVASNYDAAALADLDHDGQATWKEWTAQTDPTNAASCFAATLIRRVAGQFVVAWRGSTNRLYSVDRATNLTAGTWSELIADLPSAPENTWTDAPPAGVTTPYYRVRVRAP